MAKPKSAARRTAKKVAKKQVSASRTGSAQESLVVYVHGIGRHAPAAELKLQWDLALFGRDLGDRSRMAYWSDLVHPGSPTASTVSTKGLHAEGEELDLDAILQSADLPADDPDVLELSQALLRELETPVGPTRGQMRGKFLPLPAWARKPLSRAFIKAFIADTAAYFFKRKLRQAIRKRLYDALQIPQDRPVTIVAHSQGSIIAYEVLSSMSKEELWLDALVTIGSPLGIREVQDFLEPNTRKVPEIVERWHNFADPLDPVALDKSLASDFTLSKKAKDEGLTAVIQDEIILNGRTRLVGFNPHSAVGYLAHPQVRRAVNDAMRLDVMSPFVIARDVAERLASPPGERHRVLMEVLEPGWSAVGEDLEQTMKIEEAEKQQLWPDVPKDERRPLLLEHRIKKAADELKKLLSQESADSIDELRRFISASVTADELRLIGAMHQQIRLYAVWQSSRKSKLTYRSMRVLKADAAFTSFKADGSGITWAVLDTGVRADHPHFGDKTIHAVWDCTKRGRPVRLEKARDRDGHGTHVAGIIAGRSPAEAGLERGVAPRAKLVVYKVLDDSGHGEDAWIIKALDHIAEQNENVTGGMAIHGINLSLGGPFDNTVYGCGFSPICAELRRLWRAGVLVVVACGNEGLLQVQTTEGDTEINTAMSIGDPANLEDCIAVGSVNADRPHLYGISSFSSRGPTADGRAKPDVVAPGERIRSCNSRYRNEKDWYYEESGTSMAAPHISGLLAAFLSVRREFRGRPDEVKKILLDSCVDLGRDRYHQGRGVPNLMQMLLSV